MLNEKGLAEKDTKMHVFHYNVEHEFSGSAFIKIDIGTGLPSNSTLVPIVEMKDGFTQVFNEDRQAWEYVEDHRYTDVYSIHTKQKEEVKYIGPLKAEHTTLEPPSFNHEFLDGAWVVTDEKQAEINAAQKQQQINELEAQKSKLTAEMQMHMLLDEIEEAKAIAARIKEINAEIEQLKE